MIDAFYENKTLVLLLADRPAPELLAIDDEQRSSSAFDEVRELKVSNWYGVIIYEDLTIQVFAFDRTVSRLLEMQSVDYVKYCLENKPIGPDFIAKTLKSSKLPTAEIDVLWHHYRIGSIDEHGQNGEEYLNRDSFLVALQDIGSYLSVNRDDIKHVLNSWKHKASHRIEYSDFRDAVQKIAAL